MAYALSYGLLRAFGGLIWIINALILVRVLISWVPQLIQSHVGRLIVALTEPVLAPFRHLLMRIPALSRLPVDFSPIVAWIALSLLQWIINMLFGVFFTMLH
ncbi:YggT family protein [Ethanoligenens harbinense]|uniref:YggT family protein n=1 Tax=Ethanoligenens harbinense (strain DSM 18485 / JCM 12961 / CGMCC 1.5033 / YUAN-3) TaxID=663278 RepID=E6U2H6_ETHHY|nr:YggT family protein [Ethanoligenens harbinense]ADU26267.1 protein of unknown function YGGT [Ethanoligenens harbinense YUAN-3]AVQ95401.1 YggT family protein [Ethanoligenens harbinense YUAN-3]AYF38066.1 YggT family protein [Ethanoligenens harbinense]AYF40811.1 YggT family protein [Ethanoligenens harbinense]QCN91642.1 YggT family protein [Ethanoligenens harbinense]